MFTVKQPKAHVTLLIAVLICISTVYTLSDQTIDDTLLDLSISEDQLTHNLSDRYKELFEVDLMPKVKLESFMIKFLDTQEAQDKAALNPITIDEVKAFIHSKVSEQRKINSNLDDSFFKQIDSTVHKFLIQELITHDRMVNVENLAVHVNELTNTKTVTRNTVDPEKLQDIAQKLINSTHNILNDLSNNFKFSFPAAIEEEIENMLYSLDEEAKPQEDEPRNQIDEHEKYTTENLPDLKLKIVKLINHLTDFDHKHHISPDQKHLNVIMTDFTLISIDNSNQIFVKFGLDLIQSIYLILKEKSYNRSEGFNWLCNVIFRFLFIDINEPINFNEKFTIFIQSRKEHNNKIDLHHLESNDKRIRDLALVHVYFYFMEMMNVYMKLNNGTFGDINLFTETDAGILANNLNTLFEGRKYARINSYSTQIHNFVSLLGSRGKDYQINNIAYQTVVNLIVDKNDILNKDNFFDILNQYIEETYNKNDAKMYSETDYSIEEIYGILKTLLQISQSDKEINMKFKSIPDTTKFFRFVSEHDGFMKDFYETYFSHMLKDGELNANNKLGSSLDLQNEELLRYLQNMTFARKLINISIVLNENDHNMHSSQLAYSSVETMRKRRRV